MAKAQINFRNEHKASYLAREIAQENNRGSSLENRIETVLNQLRELTGAKNLKQLDNDKIQTYIDTLHDKLNNGELKSSTVSSYISALNRVIECANERTGKNLKNISAKEVGMNRGSIEYQNRVVSEQTHQDFRDFLGQQGDIKAQALQHSIDLQRSFGLRLRESIQIKQDTIKQALKTGTLHLGRQDGTKNSQPRDIPIRTTEQLETLKSALSFMQEHNLRSLAPTDTLKEQYHFAEHVKQEFNRVSDTKMDYHGERHWYAQERISEGATARQVSEELGHHREEILKHYIPNAGDL